jgi:hypothetical protein
MDTAHVIDEVTSRQHLPSPHVLEEAVTDQPEPPVEGITVDEVNQIHRHHIGDAGSPWAMRRAALDVLAESGRHGFAS